MDEYREHIGSVNLEEMAADEEAPERPKVYLDRSAILTIKDTQTQDVWVAEWGTFVRVRGLTSAERDRILDESRVGKGRKERLSLQGIEARFVAAAAIDADGKPLFRPSDVEHLMGKSAGAISTLNEAISKLSGLTEDDLEEIRGNSPTTQNGASPSG